jgi:NNP family nitrate/nitrite transporter-like MFS transporter
MPAIFGGRLWTTLATWSLMIPALGMGFAVQSPDTPYWIFLALALLCGFGGGNFASSMANISFFFPASEKGHALAINAGLGNLGVSVVQFVVPLVITAGVFGALGGDPQTATVGGTTTTLWLQNAGFVFVPFIAASAFAAWFGLDDIAAMKASFADQSVIFGRLHNWIMCWLYTGTFGSFIGFSAAFPLLANILFPEVNALQYAFLGPLVGAVARAVAGKPCDRIGGGRITFWVFIALSLGVAGVLYAISMKGTPSAFPVFFACFLFLFAATGVGNASTFQMIPAIMLKEVARLEPRLSALERGKQSSKEAAAIIGFTSAIAAFGAFFIPKSFGSSIAITGGPEAALYGFLLFYLSCIAITWWFYTRRGGLLFDSERGGGPQAPTSALTPAQ